MLDARIDIPWVDVDIPDGVFLTASKATCPYGTLVVPIFIGILEVKLDEERVILDEAKERSPPTPMVVFEYK